MSPQQMLDTMQRRIQGLNILPGINKAQFRAQALEEEMVGIVAGLARHAETPPGLRLDCARYIVTLARGAPQPWFHDGRTIDPDAPSATGRTVGEDIESARRETDLYLRLDALVAQRTPYRDWPDDIKALAEAQAFAALEAGDTLVAILPRNGT